MLIHVGGLTTAMLLGKEEKDMKKLNKRTYRVEQSMESYVSCTCPTCSCVTPGNNPAAALQASGANVLSSNLFQRNPGTGCAA